MLARTFGALLVLGFLTACQSNELTSTTTAKLPTVLVTNATCANGGCRTLEVRLFSWTFLVPQPPQGLRTIAEVPPGQTCLTFPASLSLKVTGIDTSGQHTDSITYTWAPGDSAGMYLIAVDSALYHSNQLSPVQLDSLRHAPFDGFGPASVGSTPTFVPATAAGWSVTFPSAPVMGATLIQGPACKP